MLPRRKQTLLLAFSVVLLLHERPVQAQVDSLRLNRYEAQQRALTHSAEIARLAAAGIHARALMRAPYLHRPEVSLEMQGTPTPWSSTDYTRRILLEQEIDLRGERRARARVGRAATVLVQRELGERSQAVAANVDLAYSLRLIAQRKAALLEPLRDRARNLRSRAEDAKRKEALSGFDARLLRSEALSIEADWLDARRALEISEAELRGWLALPPDTALALEDDLDQGSWRCDIDSAWVLARHSRLVLARGAAAESLGLARVALEERLARVNPTLGVSAGRERIEFGTGGPAAIRNEDTFVGLAVRVPIPLFGANPLRIAEARLELERVRAQQAALEREVRNEVVTACVALRRLEEQRKLRGEAAESAGRDLRLIESAYETGRIPLDEYLTLRERLIRQEVGLLDALASVERERVRLVQATGAQRAELTRRFEREK